MRERRPPYIPGDWYWIVGGDTTRVFSSARDKFISSADPAYLAWVAAGNAATRIASAGDLDEVLRDERGADNARIARNNAQIVALTRMTPSEVAGWVDVNVTNLPAARDAIKTLAIAVAVLARRI